MENNYSAPESDLSVDNNTSGMGKGHDMPEGIKAGAGGPLCLIESGHLATVHG